MVPREAVTTREGRRVVLQVAGDLVRDVAVTEGLSDGRQVQIVSGVEAGDIIVADARQEVAPGTKVNPIVK